MACAALLLVLACAASLVVGSNPIAPARVGEVLLSPDGTQASVVVNELRLPRTAVAVAVGAALALAGAVMQALTRNPLADPGILGINAGASLAVVLGVVLGFGSGLGSTVWFAFAGASVAGAGVHVLAGGSGQQRAGSGSPARLALAGVTVSAALAAVTEALVLSDQQAFNEFRFWVAGSVEGRGWDVLIAVGPFLLVGGVVALALGPSLNALSMGEETGKALGVRPGRVRALSLLAVTLLAGGATAAAGPIGFVGLAAPMLARALVGHDHRRVAVLSLLLGPVWVLVADCLARVVIAPEETQVGVVAALIGAPVFVAVVRRGRVASL
ncbi:FecCD family ABC transporter permease [Nocardioides yefusunii]|uniref:FecCD family ABC transporter permease n=1 Tax=Nocardioides yefusunii TaxID=2500546 RepID=A0ABW1QYY4_9ACTN|nr:iron ABC transporter permease [Nocardioides yefusunii]